MGGPCPATPPSTDRTGEVLIALGKISRQPLRALGVISTHLGTDTWCLVGGMMVLIASRFTGQSVDRVEQTKDADILVDICTRPDILVKVVSELRAFGFTQMEPFGEKA